MQSMKDAAGKTVGFSTTGSSSHMEVLAFLKYYGVDAKPVATGGTAATFTQVMSGQVDIGWSSPPFGIEAAREGKIRIIARGTDVAVLNDRTVRWNITNLDMLAKRPDAIQRYMQAYRETIEWMYGEAAALDIYADYAKLPASQVRNVRDYIPKTAVDPGRIAGMDEIIADAVQLKSIAAPLTETQKRELVQMPMR